MKEAFSADEMTVGFPAAGRSCLGTACLLSDGLKDLSLLALPFLCGCCFGNGSPLALFGFAAGGIVLLVSVLLFLRGLACPPGSLPLLCCC